MSGNDTPTLQLFAESMDEVTRCTWLLFDEAQTYPDLCLAALESKRMLAEADRKREIAWMFNLNRILSSPEPTHV